MPIVQRWIFAGFNLVAVFWLSACGPVYEVRDVYFPPSDPAALACVQTCSTNRTFCDNDCSERYQSCNRQAEQDALLTLPTAAQIYSAELAAYSDLKRDYVRYRTEYNEKYNRFQRRSEMLSRGCKQGNTEDCYKAQKIDDALKDLYSTYYDRGGPLHGGEPDEPVKPTLTSEAKYLRDKRCRADCGCQDKFNICYQSCGGRIETQRFCIERCK